MEFLNPGMLWGLLALSLPVVLHFWHRRKGKELDWAASRWLSSAELPPAHGIKLENILLLILRCLLLTLLILILSEPVFKQREQIHWVQPKQEVVQNFRFELEEAARRGEKRFWFNGEPVTNLQAIPQTSRVDIQWSMNRKAGHAHIYLTDRDDFTRFPKVYLPGDFTLHSVPSTVARQSAALPPLSNYHILLESREESIRAALQAITEIYQIHFEVDSLRKPGQRYDLSFTYEADSMALTNVVSDAKKLPFERTVGYHNALWFYELLNPETSDVVFDGQLPGLILEALSTAGSPPKLSIKQLEAKFAQRPATGSKNWLAAGLLVLFIVVLSAERLLATSKNA